jgi:hypothetical protein
MIGDGTSREDTFEQIMQEYRSKNCEGCPFCYIARVCDKTSQRGCRWNELKEGITYDNTK